MGHGDEGRRGGEDGVLGCRVFAHGVLFAEALAVVDFVHVGGAWRGIYVLLVGRARCGVLNVVRAK